MSAGLTAPERTRYREDGLVVPAWRVPPPLIGRLRAAYDRSVVFPGAAAAIRQNMALRPIYLVRGADRSDRHGGNDFAVGHDRPYEVAVPG